MDNINNNINFTARMDVSKVLDTKRWKNISKIFRQTTKEYPHDSFQLTEYADGIQAYATNSKTGTETSASLGLENLEKLLQMSDEKIAGTLKKILEIGSKRDKIYAATTKYIENLEKTLKHDNFDQSSIWDQSVEMAAKETAALQKQDPVLKNLDIEF